ncbi:MAG: hypothetical protein ACRD15_17075 [Vicinamibacterales bacterium]
MYDNAVTLACAIPATSGVMVCVGGRAVVEKTSKLTDRWNVEYDRREGPSTLVTIRPNQIVEVRVGE